MLTLLLVVATVEAGHEPIERVEHGPWALCGLANVAGTTCRVSCESSRRGGKLAELMLPI